MTIQGIAGQGAYWNIASTAGSMTASSTQTAAPRAAGDSVQISASATGAPVAPKTPAAMPVPDAIVFATDFNKMMDYFRPMQDGLFGVPGSGFPARLALAMGGEVEFPGAPVDSMLERSFADSHPGLELAPAFREAAMAGIPPSCEALVDLAEKMIKSVPMDWDKPMEKAYAAIRLQVGLAKCLGETKIVPNRDDGTEGFLMSKLANLKRNAQSQALAQVTVNEVMSQFGRLREVARKFDGMAAPTPQPGPNADGTANDEGNIAPGATGGLAAAAGYVPPSAIQVNHEEHYVNIGGVKVAIRH